MEQSTTTQRWNRSVPDRAAEHSGALDAELWRARLLAWTPEVQADIRRDLVASAAAPAAAAEIAAAAAAVTAFLRLPRPEADRARPERQEARKQFECKN